MITFKNIGTLVHDLQVFLQENPDWENAELVCLMDGTSMAWKRKPNQADPAEIEWTTKNLDLFKNNS